MGHFLSYELLPVVFNMTITASVVILAVLLVRFLLKKLGAPAVVSYALWAVVLFRLLCPVSFSAPFSLLGVLDSPAVTTESGASTIEYVPREIVHMENPAVELPIPVVDDAINAVLPQGEEQLRADPLEGPMFILTMIWLCGILALVLYSVVSYLRLRMRLLGAVSLEGNIRLADHITSPFVMGLFRPKIYLPSNLSETEREYIILHEQHHIRRLDHIVKILAFVALCVHWFNPLVWLAFYLSGKDMEMSCDEAVVKKLGEGIRADYSASLLKLSTGRTVIAATPLAFGEGDTKGRIQNLAKWKKPAVWITVVAVILCTAVIVLCATNAYNPGRLKISAASTSAYDVSISGRLGDEVRSWAIYEDVYQGNQRISAKLILCEEEYSEKTAKSQKVDFHITQEGNRYDGIFAGMIEKDGRVLNRWETQLPYEEYKAVMLTAGDREAFPEKLNLKINGEMILYSVAMSLDESTVVNVEEGVVGHNDTVVQYRLVTSDKVRDWPEDGEPDQPLRDGPYAAYVPYRCLYMTPYSSFAAFGGDSGERYLTGGNTFIATDHSTGAVKWKADAGLWTDWQEFPWSEEEWNSMMFWTEGMGAVDVSGYRERLYKPLTDGGCLLRMDGTLWLVDLNHNEQMGTHIYSIYSLIQETAMGSASWEFNRTPDPSAAPFASVAFPFVFDMECDEISAVCTERTLVDLDGFELPKDQPGIYSPEADHAMIFPEGHAVYWCATDAERVPAERSTIQFSVHKGEQMVCSGTIYLRGDHVEETGNTIYTANLVGTGLVIEQNPDGGAIIRLR